MTKLGLMAAGLLAIPAIVSAGDVQRVQSASDVAGTMDALEAAVTGAGATVFARVDHAGGAQKVGQELAPSELLIFGNPKLGTPAMQDDPLAGLYLPLKVLVYQDAEGQVWLNYEDPGKMLGRLDGISGEGEYIKKMTGALAKLTAKAAGE
ncbi:camphor resistance protein CrcB [Roseovarius albus]|uniref:Camphor resistance protein CrcB n=1 Tax=Roseovarius albus TaxID=1247867 RepID=A0A1X6ZU36_9RHOB|nr:DUF302 domain-containing protein [Roseovarius albus]SLN61635.1 camphor resistance protein CrcB [Roseovarius albus]